jgi:hypothetical protein
MVGQKEKAQELLFSFDQDGNLILMPVEDPAQ